MADKKGLAEGLDTGSILKEALKKGGEFSELYFEDTLSSSVICEEDKIEKVLAGRDAGCGLRVISGLKTFYAHTNDTSPGGLMELASIVACAVGSGADPGDIRVGSVVVAPGFDIKRDPAGVELAEKVAIVKSANGVARAFDKRVR